jgi:hypothetical protein
MTNPAEFPAKSSLRTAYLLSGMTAFVLTGASVLGFVLQDSLYTVAEHADEFVPNDLVNLVVGLPMFVATMIMTRRGRILGLLLWAAAPLFVFYNAIVYVTALPIGAAWILAVCLLVLSASTAVAIFGAMDQDRIYRLLHHNAYERLLGGILVVFGLGFITRVAILLAPAIADGKGIAMTELGLHIADSLMSTVWVVAGILLWKRKTSGYLLGPPLFLQVTALYIGLILILIIRPLIADVQFSIADV